MSAVTLIIEVFGRMGYQVYREPWKLNIVGIRSDKVEANHFDDWIAVFFKDNEGQWNYKQYPATTDPGTFWLRNPMAPQGTAILKEGQYANAYQIGLHQGKYTALVQRGAPVTVIRDYDRNAILDFMNGNEITGYFGINIHRANTTGVTQTVEKHSAGCQVFQNADDFAQFMNLCGKHRDFHGNQFTYTLIDVRAMNRRTKRHGTLGFLFVSAVAGFGTVLLFALKEKGGQS